MKNLLTTLFIIVFVVSCGTENNPTYTLTTSVSPSEGGTVTPTSGEYSEGEVVELRGTPSSDGWNFVRWEGDWSSTQNPTSVTMNRDYSVVGVFEINYPLTITIEGQGTVEERIVLQKSTEYPYETVVELTPIPSEGWEFVEWGGDLSGSEVPQFITVDTDKQVTVTFQLKTYPLNITVEGSGTVSVEPQLDVYPHGTEVTLTPTASEGWEFVSWGGDLSGNEVPQLVTVSDEKNVTVTFQRKNYALTITVVGEGTVTETVIPRKVTEYPFQTMIELSAIPAIIANEIWEFSGWGGDVTGIDNPVTIDVTSELNITATFSEYNLKEGEVFNPTTGRVWMDRNLGASRVATSSTDEESYGDLYQWGRGADGHEKRNSTTTTTLSSTDQPGHGSFILAPGSDSPFDWRSPQNDNLWQGVNGINNPCPVGYRLPTLAEWGTERASWSSNNPAGAFASPLKLPLAGYRDGSSGSLFRVGLFGLYWSSVVSGSEYGTYARHLYFHSSSAGMGSYHRSRGYSARCLRD